jgi:hypothetical protein
MAGSSLSIKLRCASWQQLATIYKRDLSRGSMFLKASTQPPLGTPVRIDLELPSATVIELHGVIVKHVNDPQRGTGVDLQLEPLPTKSVWMIESALAAENKVRAATGSGAAAPAPTAPTALTEGEDVAAAEGELIKALDSELESLRKLNPFLVLGVGYETTDDDVRKAFGELTKRYHPDRFARYQSVKLRQIAAEIFILIRDAYRRLSDEAARLGLIAQLGLKVPPRVPSAPRPPMPPGTGAIPRIPMQSQKIPAKPGPGEGPTMHPQGKAAPGQHDAPTNPSAKSAQLASTELARADQVSGLADRSDAPKATLPIPPGPPAARRAGTVPAPEPIDTSGLEEMIEAGKLDEALAGYRGLLKKHVGDRAVRAGIELCEGLKALIARDRLEAAQRFEAALELDPSNERAARELAEMRRQATNERKGLLSRLMGKKETP